MVSTQTHSMMELSSDFPSALRLVILAALSTMKATLNSSSLIFKSLDPSYSFFLEMSNKLPLVALMQVTGNQSY